MESDISKELIEQCRNADRRAQAAIFKSYYSDFMKICMRYSSDKQSAEAILNDSFFKIFTKIDTYSGLGSFEGWMRKIVVNTCLSFIKQNKNANKITIVQADSDITTINMPYDDNQGLSNLSIQELSVHIQSLPKMSRAVFNLNVFEGYTHKEIAKSLGISEGTSHWHLNFARQSLKSKIKIANHG